jgi:nuclear pore complex protein Nup62
MLATDLHTHLDDLSTSLTQLIDSVNSLSQPLSSGAPDASTSSATGVEDPMTRITQILSGHLESLQWVDGAVRDVENRVTEVEKRVKDSSRGPATLSGNNGMRSRNFGLHR